MPYRDYNNDKEYKNFRYKVRRRDKACCRWPFCKARKGLQVHHIFRWADFPHLRYDPDNGITLCKTHHKYVTEHGEINFISLLTSLVNQAKNGKKKR